MAITIELPADVEKRLEQNARDRGLTPGEYVGQLIDQSSPRTQPHASAATIRETLAKLGRIVPADTPSPSDESLRRENMYEREDDIV